MEGIKQGDNDRMLTDDHAPIEITDSTLDLEALFAVLENVAGFTAQARDDLILIVPSDLGSRYEGVVFPGGTREFFRYLRGHVGDQAIVEAAVHDDDYQEFQFLSADIILPALYVASNVLLPLAVNLLSDWMSRRLHIGVGQESDKKVKAEVHFNQQGRLKNITYEGPASTFESIMLEAIRDEKAPCSTSEDDDARPVH